jgi:hypothetical protein
LVESTDLNAETIGILKTISSLSISFKKPFRCMSWPEDHAGWRLTKTAKIENLSATSLLYVHSKHKCQFWVLQVPDDPNNSFAVTFKTIPNDDMGLFHMLEHLVLNGSENYRIPDV